MDHGDGRGPAAADSIRKLEKTGTRVVVAQADVSQKEKIAGTLKQISESMPPLQGIVHTAGVLDDGILIQQDVV